MSIFKRIKDIVNSNINSLLDRAEDPEKMLRLMIGEMEEAVVDIKGKTATEIANLKRAEKRVQEAEKSVSRWQERAELAVVKGSDEMAKKAILARKEAEEILKVAKEDYENLKDLVEKGKKEIADLENKAEEAKTKLKTLPTKVVEVKVKEEKKKTPEIKRSARFEDMENRINRIEAYRELTQKKREIKKEEKSTQEKIEELEIQEEIERIKKEKGIA